MLATLFSFPLPIFTFYMPRHPSRKRSLAWQRTVCERQRFRSFFLLLIAVSAVCSFSFESIQGSSFAMPTLCTLTLLLSLLFIYRPVRFFFPIFFFSFIIVSTYWRWLTCLNDYAIHLSATVFLLYLWSCHDLPFHSCFFSLQSVQNKNANWGQLQKKKKTSTWLEKWEILGKSNTTLCHAQQIKIGCQLKTRRMQIVATMQPKTNKNKELFSSTFLTVYFIYCSFFILNFFSSWKNSRNRLCL